MDKQQGIERKDELVAKDELLEESGIENANEDTQLTAQSRDRNFIDPVTSAGWLTWIGTLLLRSILTFFTMEFVRAWWKKYQDLYWPKESEEEEVDEPTEAVSKEAEKPKT